MEIAHIATSYPLRMATYFRHIMLTLSLVANSTQTFAQVPESTSASAEASALAFSNQMSPGWNLGNALEALAPGGKATTSQEGAWGNPPVTASLMKAVFAAGFRSVRIPVSWSQYTTRDNQISDAWLKRVEEVVGYARKADLYVIINIHWDGGWLQPTNASREAANAKLAQLWTQIGNRFRNYDDHLLFAGTNEIAVKDVYTAPTDENCAFQNGFNQMFVDTVRATGGGNASRYLVVQGYNTNIDYSVACNATLPRDSATDKLMMEVHFYDPYDFTLNTSSKIWQWGVITTDKNAAQSWADEKHVDTQFQKMKSLFVDKGVPVLSGEYSASLRAEYDSTGKYRTYWDAYVTRSARKHGMVPYYWDSGYVANHQSGLFDRARSTKAFPGLIQVITDLGK